jgi:hypothetical protein
MSSGSKNGTQIYYPFFSKSPGKRTHPGSPKGPLWREMPIVRDFSTYPPRSPARDPSLQVGKSLCYVLCVYCWHTPLSPPSTISIAIVWTFGANWGDVCCIPNFDGEHQHERLRRRMENYNFTFSIPCIIIQLLQFDSSNALSFIKITIILQHTILYMFRAFVRIVIMEK